MRNFIHKAQLVMASTKGRVLLTIALVALSAIAGGADGDSGP
jgi:hypothetical protein